MEKSLKALAELRNIIESVKIFSPTLYVALLIYNAIIIIMERLQKNDDIRRTTRIIQIDEMLRGGAYVKINSLVQKFEVSQRTIERDFERLRDDLNAPLEYDKSKNMYHYTDSTFSVPNVILTEGELFTVSTLFPLMEQYKNTPLESSFKNIMEKLVSFLPDTVS